MRLGKIPEKYRDAYKALVASLNTIETELENLNIEREKRIKEAVREIDEKIADLQNNLDSVKKSIEPLIPKKEEVYPAGNTWRDKILWAINSNKRISAVSEIVAKLSDYENEASNLPQIVRMNLRRMTDKKEIIRYGKNTKYGLPEWFINDRPKTVYL